MKIIEEQFLHDNYLNINEYINKNIKIDSIFKNIDNLNIFSVQDSSIKNDIMFFDEISFILSVITSIISKPKLVTKQEESVIRSELVPSIQFDTFQTTLKDSKMWQHKGTRMLPKEMYYNQTSDEIVTYENRFIVRLIDIIEQEISKYNQFYLSLIKTFEDGKDLLLDNNDQENALIKLKTLDRKIKYIKATYFYRIVKRSLGDLGRIVPTNILLKNRLYNYCYKFYRKHIKYEENETLYKEFKTYYLFLILKTLNRLDFKCVNKIKYNDNLDFNFKNKFFNLNILNYENGFKFIITNLITSDSVSHLLVLDVNNDFTGLSNKLIKEKDYLTKEAINLFKIVEINDLNDNLKLNILTDNVKKEEELIYLYIKNKIQTPKGVSSLYTKVCPICKSGHLHNVGNDFICEDCNSVYTFFTSNNNEYIHIKKLRRK